MRILIAEDDAVSRCILETTLEKWGHDVVRTTDGDQAWNVFQKENPPKLAILDWMMPGADGVDLCRRLRDDPKLKSTYLILLTAKVASTDMVSGLEAGADDYITKPFNSQELRARVNVGIRVVSLQTELASRVRDLEDALSRVKQLQGLLPICSYCKRVRDDKNYWQQVDSYLASHAEIAISHSICPSCLDAELAKLKA